MEFFLLSPDLGVLSPIHNECQVLVLHEMRDFIALLNKKSELSLDTQLMSAAGFLSTFL
jgi:hypothetical protein